MREPVIKSDLLAVKVIRFVIAVNLTPNGDGKPLNVAHIQRGNTTDTFRHSGLRGSDITAKRIDCARPRNDDAGH